MYYLYYQIIVIEKSDTLNLLHDFLNEMQICFNTDGGELPESFWNKM